MWIEATQVSKSRDKIEQIRAFSRQVDNSLETRICGRNVDDMCVQLYESNQRSKHYNKIL